VPPGARGPLASFLLRHCAYSWQTEHCSHWPRWRWSWSWYESEAVYAMVIDVSGERCCDDDCLHIVNLQCFSVGRCVIGQNHCRGCCGIAIWMLLAPWNIFSSHFFSLFRNLHLNRGTVTKAKCSTKQINYDSSDYSTPLGNDALIQGEAVFQHVREPTGCFVWPLLKETKGLQQVRF